MPASTLREQLRHQHARAFQLHHAHAARVHGMQGLEIAERRDASAQLAARARESSRPPDTDDLLAIDRDVDGAPGRASCTSALMRRPPLRRDPAASSPIRRRCTRSARARRSTHPSWPVPTPPSSASSAATPPAFAWRRAGAAPPPAAPCPRGTARTARTIRRGRTPRCGGSPASSMSVVSSNAMITPEPSVTPGRARALEGERDVELVGANEHARRAAEQDRLERRCRRGPPASVEQISQRRAEGHLVHAGPLDGAGEAEQPRAGRVLGADGRECGPAIAGR